MSNEEALKLIKELLIQAIISMKEFNDRINKEYPNCKSSNDI